MSGQSKGGSVAPNRPPPPPLAQRAPLGAIWESRDLEDAFFALPRFELTDQESFYSSLPRHPPTNHSPIVLGASDPSFKIPRTGQASLEPEASLGGGHPISPFISLAFISVPPHHYRTWVPTYLPGIPSSTPTSPCPPKPTQMSYPEQTCSQALQAPHSSVPHLPGYSHHETRCLQSHCSPHSERSSL